MRRLKSYVLTITFSLAISHSLSKAAPQENTSGQNLDSQVSEEPIDEAFEHEIDTYVRYMPSRSLKSQSGKISIIESGTEYSYNFKAFNKLPLQLSLESQYLELKDSDIAVSLPTHLTGLSVGLETTLPFFRFDKTYLRVSLMPSFYTDDWSARSSAFRLPSHTFLIYQPTEQWTFIGGIAVYPDFESPVWPILGFIYKPNAQLTFKIIPDRPNISYQLNDRITLFGEGRFSYDEFEVTKDNLKGVVLRYQGAYLGAGVKFKVNKYIQTSISSGGTFNRYLRYRDSLGKVNIKDDLYCEFRAETGL